MKMSKISQPNIFKKQRQAPKKYQDLPEEEKNRKQEYSSKKYKNIQEDETHRLVKYRKKIL